MLNSFTNLSAAAVARTNHTVRYDPAYVRRAYPVRDVPADIGLCTDERIRSCRALAIDLQQEVLEGVVQNFAHYPRKWRWLRSRPDANIDHRRVPNWMVFFGRKGKSLPITDRSEDYSPGDLVPWDLGRAVPHIGIPVDPNLGQGLKVEDVLFSRKITGNYQCFGPNP
jgi:uncharacterized protein